MSYIYLLEPGGVSSAECFSDIPASVLSSGTSTPATCCSPDNATDACPSSQSGTMCKPSTEPHGEAALTSCAVASPARTLAQPERAQESTANGRGCGSIWPASLAKYDPASSSWRTHQFLLHGDLEEFSETWPRWGMMLAGEFWEQPTWEHRISGTESGSSERWPTPTAVARDNLTINSELINGRVVQASGKDFALSLASAVRIWPTPCAKGSRSEGQIRQMRKLVDLGHLTREQAESIIGGTLEPPRMETWPTPRRCSAMAATITPEAAHNPARFPNLETVVGQRTWPTPTAHNAKECDAPSEADRNQPSLAHLARGGNETQPKHLDPDWVEWLMGWPIGWTALNASAMDRFQQWRHSHSKCFCSGL